MRRSDARVKANRSALEYSSSKADELKVEFSAE